MMQYGQSAQVDSDIARPTGRLACSTASLDLGSIAAATSGSRNVANAQKLTIPIFFNFIQAFSFSKNRN